MTERVRVGTIGGAYGVKGEVRIKSFCAIPEAIADYAPLTTEDGSRTFEVTITRQISNGLAARMTGIDSKEDADALRGMGLYALRSQLPETDDDEYYYADLIGLDVFDTGGNPIGKIKAVQNHGATDLLEVFGPGLKTTVLIPFTKDVVPTVDIASGRVIADPPEGLFD